MNESQKVDEQLNITFNNVRVFFGRSGLQGGLKSEINASEGSHLTFWTTLYILTKDGLYGVQYNHNSDSVR